MTTEQVRFYSHGARPRRHAAPARRRVSAEAPVAAVVQGPGWLGPARREAVPAVPRRAARGRDRRARVRLPRLRRFRGRRHLPRSADAGRGLSAARSTYLETRPEIDPRSARRLRVGRDRWRQRDHGGRPRRALQGDGQPGARSRMAATGCTGCAASTSGSSSSSGCARTGWSACVTGEAASWSRRATGSWSRRPSARRRPSRPTSTSRVPAQVAAGQRRGDLRVPTDRRRRPASRRGPRCSSASRTTRRRPRTTATRCTSRPAARSGWSSRPARRTTPPTRSTATS